MTAQRPPGGAELSYVLITTLQQDRGRLGGTDSAILAFVLPMGQFKVWDLIADRVGRGRAPRILVRTRRSD